MCDEPTSSPYCPTTLVGKGDLLGYVASSGASSGNHLHFQVDIDGRATPYFPSNLNLPNWARALRNQGGGYESLFRHVNIPDQWASLDAHDDTPGSLWYVPQNLKEEVGYPQGETEFFDISRDFTTNPSLLVADLADHQPSEDLEIGRWASPDAPSDLLSGPIEGWDYRQGSESEKIADLFNRYGGSEGLGSAFDNGGGTRVHRYSFEYVGNGTDREVYLQDVLHPEFGQKTITLAPGGERAFLLEGCLGFLWWQYKDILGVPTSNESSDTANFPDNLGTVYDVMQSYQHGNMFWDEESGNVRLICDLGTCEEAEIEACNLSSLKSVWNLRRRPKATSTSCDELRAQASNGSAGLFLSPSGNQVGDIDISVSASDSNGLAQVRVRFNDDSDLSICDDASANPCTGTSYSRTVTGIDPGNYGATPGTVTLGLWVWDTLGNQTQVATRTFGWSEEGSGGGGGGGSDHDLVLEKQGGGQGRIFIDGNVVCDGSCDTVTLRYDDGDSFEISAEADPGFVFVGFAGDRCYGSSACTVNMYSDLEVRVSFGLPESLEVLYTSPAEGDSSAVASPMFYFNRPVNPGPNFGNMILRQSNGTPIPFNPLISQYQQPARHRLYLQTDVPVEDGQTYVATVPAGAVVDDDGNELPLPYSVQWTVPDGELPDMYISAYPRQLVENDRTLLSVWFNEPFEEDRAIYISSTPDGVLDHISEITLPAGEVLVEEWIDADLTPGDYGEERPALRVSSPGYGQQSLDIIVGNLTPRSLSGVTWLTGGVIRDDDGDGVAEAGENVDYLFEVSNLGSTGEYVILHFKVLNAVGFLDIRGDFGDELCHLAYMDPGEYKNCEVELRIDEDLPGGDYYIEVEARTQFGQVLFLNQARLRVVNDVLPDYSIRLPYVTNIELEPGRVIDIDVDTKQNSDGSDPAMIPFELVMDIEGTEHVLYSTYTDVRGAGETFRDFELPIVVPNVPGEHDIWARINPSNGIVESDYSNNQSVIKKIRVAGPNEAPVLQTIPSPISGVAGETVTLDLSATDGDDTSLSFAMSGQPVGSSLSSTGAKTARFEWAVPADLAHGSSFSVDFTVSDDDGAEDLQTVVFDSTRQSDWQVQDSGSPPIVTPGEPIDITLTATNHGPSQSSNSTISASLLGLGQVSWECLDGGGQSCGSGSGNLSLFMVELDPGATLTFQISGTYQDDGSGAGSFDFEATDLRDPVAGNNSISRTTSFRALDFGDAPESTINGPGGYPTSMMANGARHGIEGTLLLGAVIDGETDGQAGDSAEGDDTLGADDEDGVVFGEALVPCTEADVQVQVTGSGLLDAWLDFDRDGVWVEAERIANSMAVSSGPQSLTVTVPCSASLGHTFARFRLSDTGGLSPSGLARIGEVEDYRVTIEPPDGPPTLTIHEPNGIDDIVRDGFTITWTGADAESDASIDLFYDLDADPGGGMPIVVGLSEDSSTSFFWDGAGLVDGPYYVYGVIDDGVNPPVTAYSSGPVTFDRTPPTVPVLSSISHTVGTPSDEVVIRVGWSGATDTFAGVAGYSFEYSSAADWTCDRAQDAPAGLNATASDALADGEWYFHLCVVDAVGNWSDSVSAGPYVIETVETTASHRDSFNTVANYAGDDGDRPWPGSWRETPNDGGSPGWGHVRVITDGDVDHGVSQLRIRRDGMWVERPVDLSGAGEVTWSFDYRRESLLDGHYVAAEVSSDGSSWTEVARLAGPADDAGYQQMSVSIPVDTTKIRFANPAGIGMGNGNMVFFDNVEVTLDLGPSMRSSVNSLPNTVVTPGGPVTLVITVENTSPFGTLELTTLEGSLGGEVASTVHGSGTCSVPQSLAVGETYTCQLERQITGSGGSTVEYELTAAGSVGGEPLTAQASTTVGILEDVEANAKDAFASVSYAGDDGTVPWTSNWIEAPIDGSQASWGDVRILEDGIVPHSEGPYQAFIRDDQLWLRRKVDLTGFSAAELDFDYRRSHLLPGQRLDIEVSTDGVTFERLASIEGSEQGTDLSYSRWTPPLDLSPYISSSTWIQFSNLEDLGMGNSNAVYLDNVEIRLQSGSSIALGLTVDPDTVVEPAGPVTFEVTVTNHSPSGSVELTELMDDQIGDLNGVGSCSTPRTVLAGDSYVCSYGHTVSGAAGSTITHVVSAAASAGGEMLNADSSVDVAVEAPGLETLRDELKSVSFHGNDGTMSWSSPWIESISDGGAPYHGHVRVEEDAVGTGPYALRIRRDDRWVQREADLSGFAQASLTFDYRRNNLLAGHRADVEVSLDGSSWTTLDQLEGPALDQVYQKAVYDLSPWISPATWIRFHVPAGQGMGNGNLIYFDNIEIQLTEPVDGESGQGPERMTGNLLSNPSFEQGLGYWELISPEPLGILPFELEDSASLSRGRMAEIESPTGEGRYALSQCVQIQPGRLYAFGGEARAQAPSFTDPVVSMGVELFGRDGCGGEVLSATGEVLWIGDSEGRWQSTYRGRAEASEKAVSARVWVVVQGEGAEGYRVWLDNLSFRMTRQAP